jgi:acyl carrier protein
LSGSTDRDANLAARRPAVLSLIDAAVASLPSGRSVLDVHDERGTLIREVRACRSTLRRSLLLDRLKSMLEGIVGQHQLGSLSARQRFFELGLGSLVVIELRSQLERALDVEELPVTLFFKHSSVGELADYLLDHVIDSAPAPAGPAPDAERARDCDPELLQVESMSEEQARARMLEKLEELEKPEKTTDR